MNEYHGRGLTLEQIALFRRDGFLAIESLLADDDLAAITIEYDELLEAHIDQLLAARRIDERPHR